MKTAIIGAGAAGMFLAINLKEMLPDMDVTVFEKNAKVLSKVAISGGGRCNCTNTFQMINAEFYNKKRLSLLYPRGFLMMGNLFRIFSPKDTVNWFELHGVRLKSETDGRIFPMSDDSGTIVNMFVHYAKKYGINIHTDKPITSLHELNDYDFICITTGGMLHNKDLSDCLSNVTDCKFIPKPSLFGFNINEDKLRALSGTSIDAVTVSIPAAKLKVTDTLLITHKGLSGPVILKLSSYGSDFLYNNGYNTKILIKWINKPDNKINDLIVQTKENNANKIIINTNAFALPQRIWKYLLEKTMPNRIDIRYKDLTQKEINRIVNTLCNDEYTLNGRNTNKDEFVTCGGIPYECLNSNTLQLKNNERLFFAGEVIDCDGITGGFNFQSAWTTAYSVAKAIADICIQNKK